MTGFGRSDRKMMRFCVRFRSGVRLWTVVSLHILLIANKLWFWHDISSYNGIIFMQWTENLPRMSAGDVC